MSSETVYDSLLDRLNRLPPGSTDSFAPPLVPGDLNTKHELLWKSGTELSTELPETEGLKAERSPAGGEAPFSPTQLPAATKQLFTDKRVIAGTATAAVLLVVLIAYSLVPAKVVPPQSQTEPRASVEPGQQKPVISEERVSRPVEEALSAPAPSSGDMSAAKSPLQRASSPIPDPWPAAPARVEAPQTSSSASTMTSVAPQTPTSVQSPRVLYLQKQGVNIRSAPSSGGTVVGSAAKSTRFDIAKREGEWAQVSNGRLNGWINTRFLGPDVPR